MEKLNERKPKHNSMKKVVFGLLVIAAGILLLLFNTDVISSSYKHIVFSWQMLLIALGLINLASRESRMIGWILFAVGGFFILPKIFDFDFNFVGMLWPALLIFVGLMILFFGRATGCWHHKHSHSSTEGGFISETNIFGGSKIRFDEEVFKGGKVTNIFGGSEIDLTQASCEGKTNLEIDCIFGGVELIVPSDWKVNMKVSSILGGTSDKRKAFKPIEGNTNELIISGSVIFGGVEIKSY